MAEDSIVKCLGWTCLFISGIALYHIKDYSKEIYSLRKQKEAINRQRHPYVPGKIPLTASSGQLAMLSGLAFRGDRIKDFKTD